MAYCVRNPIYNATFREFPTHGLVSRVRLRSRCYDAHLVIDGRLAYKFNDGAEVVLEVFFRFLQKLQWLQTSTLYKAYAIENIFYLVMWFS
ncbi:unnamed protein product [Gongylonema pulchrum]|uniref:DNA helicase n=1 Tax=Gongylonema pulchrum TaxID=637853 RepID=A0A183E3F4_9BILA|nr:unnamed protein product [Gongylonema pulchrum]